jgi:hypothetical protein
MRCPFCGFRFEASSLIGVTGGSARVTIAGTRVSCPRCGRLAEQTVEGEFEISEDGRWQHLAAALASREATGKDYETLAALLRSAQTLGMGQEEIARNVREKIPRLGAVGDFINSSRGDRIALWLTVILTVLAWLKPVGEPPPHQAPPSISVVVQQPSEQKIRELTKIAVEEANREADRRAKEHRPKKR